MSTSSQPRRCLICAAPVVEKYRPFCSKRCADIDLARWFNEDYRVPTIDPFADEADLADPGRDSEDY